MNPQNRTGVFPCIVLSPKFRRYQDVVNAAKKQDAFVVEPKNTNLPTMIYPRETENREGERFYRFELPRGILYGDMVRCSLNGVEEVWHEHQEGNYRYILPLSDIWDTMDDNESDPTTEQETDDGVLSVGQSTTKMYLLDFLGRVTTVNSEQIALINLTIRYYTLVTDMDGILVRRAVKTMKDFIDYPTAACRILESLQHAEELILRHHAAQTPKQGSQTASPPTPSTPEPPRAPVPATVPAPAKVAAQQPPPPPRRFVGKPQSRVERMFPGFKNPPVSGASPDADESSDDIGNRR